MAASPSDLLATQVEEKEKEWRQLEKERQYRLLTELNEKDAKIQQLQKSLVELQDDFEYNIKLIHERDNELNKFDELYEEFKSLLQAKEFELSDVRIKNDDLAAALGRERNRAKILCDDNHEQIRKLQAEFDEKIKNLNGAWRDDKLKHEEQVFDLQRHIKELQLKREIELGEIKMEFETVLAASYSDLRTELIEKEDVMNELKLENQHLKREVHNASAAKEKWQHEFEAQSCQMDGLRKQIKTLEFELRDKQNEVKLIQTESDWKMDSMKVEQNEIFKELQAQLQSAEAAAHEATSRHTALLAKAAQREAELILQRNELQEQTIHLKTRLVSAEKHKGEPHEVNYGHQELIADLQSTVTQQRENYEKSITARDMEIESLRVKLKETETTKRHLAEEMERLCRDVEAVRSQDQARNSILESALKRLDANPDPGDATSDVVTALLSAQSDLFANISASEQLNSSLRHENEGLLKELQRERSEKAELAQEFSVLTRSLQSEVDACDGGNQLNAVISAQRQEILRLQQRIARQEQDPTDADSPLLRRVNELNAIIAELRDQVRAAENARSACTLDLEQMRLSHTHLQEELQSTKELLFEHSASTADLRQFAEKLAETADSLTGDLQGSNLARDTLLQGIKNHLTGWKTLQSMLDELEHSLKEYAHGEPFPTDPSQAFADCLGITQNLSEIHHTMLESLRNTLSSYQTNLPRHNAVNSHQKVLFDKLRKTTSVMQQELAELKVENNKLKFEMLPTADLRSRSNRLDHVGLESSISSSPSVPDVSENEGVSNGLDTRAKSSAAIVNQKRGQSEDSIHNEPQANSSSVPLQEKLERPFTAGSLLSSIGSLDGRLQSVWNLIDEKGSRPTTATQDRRQLRDSLQDVHILSFDEDLALAPTPQPSGPSKTSNTTRPVHPKQQAAGTAALQQLPRNYNLSDEEWRHHTS